MYVAAHARARLLERLPGVRGERVLSLLEACTVPPGKVAVIAGTLPHKAPAPAPVGQWWKASVGDVIVAIAVDGSVDTVFFRRASQDMSAGFFGASRLVDLRGA